MPGLGPLPFSRLLPRKLLLILALWLYALLLLTTGCGGGSQSVAGPPPAPLGDFSVGVASQSIVVQQGSSEDLAVQITPLNGFSGSVQVTVLGLPTGLSASALTISVSTGSASGALHFTATNNAPVASSSVTISAVSGSLQHDTSLTAAISVSPATQPFLTIGGGIVRGYSDPQRQLLFVSNLLLNEVDVISTASRSISRRLEIPQPVGIDQMPDGKTLVVGTLTQGIYFVNEETFAIEANFVPVPPPPDSAFNILPAIPVAMANGKILFIAVRQGVFANYNLGGRIYEWNTAANTFAPIAVSPTGPAETEHLARSGDHKFAIFNQFGGGVFLYSSDSDSLISIDNNFYAGDVAGNPDGSQFAESINGAINFYDRNLKLLASVTPDSARPGFAELATDFGMQYSSDGSLLYVQVSDQALSPIAVIDAKQFKEIGMIPAYILNPGQPAYLLASGVGQTVYISSHGGVGTVDSSHPLMSLTQYQVFPLESEPDSSPLNRASTVTLSANNIPSQTKITVGGVPAAIQSNSPGQLVIQIPASFMAGPADIVFSMPDGTTIVLPQDFSYGVTPSALSATLIPDQVKAHLVLAGFGLAPPSQAPRVLLGTAPATDVTLAFNGIGQNSLEGIQMNAPASAIGTFDLTVNNASGSGTLKSALTVVHTSVVPAASGLSSLLFDVHRNLLYATRTNATEIYVFDPGTLQWKAPLQPPGAKANSTYNFFALTPDGTRLVALDTTNVTVSVFNPDNPSAGQSISLNNSSVPNGPPPNLNPPLQANFLGITSTGKIWTITSWHPAEIDLSNLALVYRTDAGLALGGLGCGDFRMSLDSTQLISGCGGTSDSGVQVWNPGTDSFQGQGYQEFFEDFAVSNDGKKIAAIDIDQLAPDDVTLLIDSQLHFVNKVAYPDLSPPQSRASFGIQFSPQSQVLLIPRLDSIDFVDAATGKMRARYATPEPIITPQNVVNIVNALAIDGTGKTIFSISASGLTVVEFTSPIDNLPKPIWPFSVKHPEVQSRVPQLHPAAANSAPRSVPASLKH